MKVTAIGDGIYRVEVDDRTELVYVAGPLGQRWAFWRGQVFRSAAEDRAGTSRTARPEVAHALTAPMPATVLKVLVRPGTAATKGETMVILEAMKMELPIRATADGTVKAVRCREGELVQPETVLVEFE